MKLINNQLYVVLIFYNCPPIVPQIRKLMIGGGGTVFLKILRDIFISPDEAIRKEGRSQYETKNAQLLTNEVWHETPLSKFTKTSG